MAIKRLILNDKLFISWLDADAEPGINRGVN
jgi:hypothetical protein